MFEAIWAGIHKAWDFYAEVWESMVAVARRWERWLEGTPPERPQPTHRGRLVLQQDTDLPDGGSRSVVTSSPWSLPVDEDPARGVIITNLPDLKCERIAMTMGWRVRPVCRRRGTPSPSPGPWRRGSGP